jgi:hypothetical protein
MKTKFKVTNRERWVIAFAPSLLILGVYLFGMYDGITGALEKERKHLASVSGPMPKPGDSPALARAKADHDDVKKNIAERQDRIAELDSLLAAAKSTAQEDRDAAQLIQRVESIFADNNITPLISEPADDADAASAAPVVILDTLAPKGPTGARDGRVWHCVFDDQPQHFEVALKHIQQELPGVVPLSLNLVYNPTNFGETRLLELWLLY